MSNEHIFLLKGTILQLPMKYMTGKPDALQNCFVTIKYISVYVWDQKQAWHDCIARWMGLYFLTDTVTPVDMTATRTLTMSVLFLPISCQIKYW